MSEAADADGVSLLVTSGFRSSAEQAVLFAAHPDPKWVAPPGKSLHRLGTELDIGPSSAYAWLAANADRFGFLQRYSWEPWHYGYTRNAGTTSLGYGGSGERGGGGSLPSWVPQQYETALVKASQRWSISAALLAAQIRAESNFNPDARSPVGALGLSQFMPATAASYGIDPLDPAQAIDGQAHLMHDLLRQFADVKLALAAYNAGPGNVSPCMCIPAFPETQAYVAKILGYLHGSGDDAGFGVALSFRLVA
jgi:hypothetical protein